MAGLFCRGWLELRARGFTRAVAIAPDRVIDLFRSSGLVVNVLGEPREYWGELRAPVEVAGAAGTFAAVEPGGMPSAHGVGAGASRA